MKKTIGVMLGVSFLSATAYTAFAADFLTNTLTDTSVVAPTTSTVDVKTTNTSVSTTDTTTTVSTDTATVNTTTATPTTSPSLVLNTPLTFQLALGGGDTTVKGTEYVLIKVNQPVKTMEVVLTSAESSVITRLGAATYDAANDRWVYTWDSANRTPDGMYLLLVRAMVPGATAPNSSKGMKVVVANNEKVAVAAPSVADQRIKEVQQENQRKLDYVKKKISADIKESAVQNESAQSSSGEKILAHTVGDGLPTRPSKLTSTIDFEKVINENSQKLKDAIDQGDTKKENAVVAEIVRVAQGNSVQADTEITKKVEEGVAKLKQVLVDQTHGVVDETTFKVESVKVAEVITKPDGTQTASKIEFRGKALPNSFVTVYIYSIPIVVTVKADSEGNWNYTLDKELDNGNHQVYVGLTDVKGKVVVKSNPLPFVKTASAITVEEALAVPQAEAAPNFVQNNNFYGIVTIIILVLISVFIFLGFKMSKNPNNPTE